MIVSGSGELPCNHSELLKFLHVLWISSQIDVEFGSFEQFLSSWNENLPVLPALNTPVRQHSASENITISSSSSTVQHCYTDFSSLLAATYDSKISSWHVSASSPKSPDNRSVCSNEKKCSEQEIKSTSEELNDNNPLDLFINAKFCVDEKSFVSNENLSEMSSTLDHLDIDDTFNGNEIELQVIKEKARASSLSEPYAAQADLVISPKFDLLGRVVAIDEKKDSASVSKSTPGQIPQEVSASEPFYTSTALPLYPRQS
ncbi:hypothetical protein HK098_005737 [Nowakowskiella sp. JEL0407]|nr:hypothetical protein HK098_005737 [Nowakowskiella sp. JEL0407]